MKKILIVNLNIAIDKTCEVDKFERGRIYRVSDVTTMPGGKGVNVARALETMGQSTRLIGFVAGHNGEWIKEALRREGLDAVCVPFSPGESRVCFSIVDSRDGVSTDINEEGFAVPPKARRIFETKFRENLKDCDAVAFSGRISAGLQKDFFARLISLARREGKLTAIDTSGEPLLRAAEAGPTLIKMNRSEFEEAFGVTFVPTQVVKFFRKYFKKGIQYAVITDGPFATYAVTPQNLWKFYPPGIKPVNAVGAGDSFLAGLLYGFSKGMTRQQCARMGLGFAASDCLSLGAGSVKRQECELYAKRAVLQRLSVKI